MTLTLALARDLLETEIDDTSLQLLIDAIGADIRRLGGDAYPIQLSGALVEVSAVSAAGAGSARQRNFFGGEPAIGNPLIKTTDTSLIDVSYTLAVIDSGVVTIAIEGESARETESMADLAGGALDELAFYLVTHDGRIELAFADADAKVDARPGRVQWQVATTRQDAARTLLTRVGEHERVRFAIARIHAGLRMPVSEWQAALTRIAVSCLRLAVSDEGVARYMERGADSQQALEYLSYSSEYRERLNQMLSLAGGWFS